MKKTILLATTALVMTPAVVSAQNVQGALRTVKDVFDALIPIFVALALIYFIYGLAQYILKAGDEDGRRGARDTMIWGVIALFVIVSIWGLVNVLQQTFLNTTNPDTTAPAPQVSDTISR